MKVAIKQFSKSDQGETKNFILEVWREFGFDYTKKYDQDLDDIYGFYIENGGMFYVLKYNEKIIGTMGIISKGNNTAELKRFYVEKIYRGRGFGSKLVNKAMEFCNKHGFTRAEFETNKKFKIAHALYLKRGFKIIKEDDRSYYMEKLLIEV